MKSLYPLLVETEIIAIIFGISKAYTYFKNKPSTKKPVTVLVKDVDALNQSHFYQF